MSPRGRLMLSAAPVVVVAAALVTTAPAGARFALTGLAALVLPGLGWARQMRFRKAGDSVALAVVLSVGTVVAVGVPVAAGTWSLGGGLAVLALVTAAGFVPSRTFACRAMTAARARAQRRREGAEEVALATSEVWLNWSVDLARRAEQVRVRKNAAAQQATQDWILWYQRTHLLALRHGD